MKLKFIHAIELEKPKSDRREYHREYRQKNKQKVIKSSKERKQKHRLNIQDCYIIDILKKRGIDKETIKLMPEIIETKRLQIQIHRKIKSYEK